MSIAEPLKNIISYEWAKMSFLQQELEKLKITKEMFVEALIADIREVFRMMVGIENIPRTPLLIEPIIHFENSLTAMVGLTSTYSGLVCFHTTKNFAFKIASGMLGMEINELNEDVSDALGEITNVLTGSFKVHLARCGAKIKSSTPSVIASPDYNISAGSPENTITMRFSIGYDWFIVSVTLEDN